MGSYMIWNMIFKDKKSKKAFESMMNNKYIQAREIHDHYHSDVSDHYGDFYYDVGYLGYAEAEELKPKLKEIGIIELKQICLCDIDGTEIIRLR